jgi:hypothetical protein
MIEPNDLSALRIIHARLKNSDVIWAVTGSLGMSLQGMPVEVHDIDIQTSEPGAYEIERRFSDYVTTPVRYSSSERIRSHLGKLEINGIKVEIMGAIQKRSDDVWEEPVRMERYRNWVEIEGMQIPVLSLDYEYQAYRKLGRVEKANMIKEWLQNHSNK